MVTHTYNPRTRGVEAERLSLKPAKATKQDPIFKKILFFSALLVQYVCVNIYLYIRLHICVCVCDRLS